MDDRIKILRDRIDVIDKKLADLVKSRFRAAREIGRLKKELKLPVTDELREAEVKARFLSGFKEEEKPAAEAVISAVIESCGGLER